MPAGSEQPWYERTARLLGEGGVSRLRNAHVCVAGLGGVGSAAADALVRAGVGHLTVLDGDEVQLTNINRQALAFLSTLGHPKVEVFKAYAHDINPSCEVTAKRVHLLHADVPAFLASLGSCDYLIDALDSVSVKLAFAQYAPKQNLALISVLGTANKFNPQKLCVRDLFQTQNDPIARVMRKEARKLGISSLTTLFSSEKPASIPAAATSARSERTQLGTMSYLPAIAGKMAAGYVLCALIGRKWEP